MNIRTRPDSDKQPSVRSSKERSNRAAWIAARWAVGVAGLILCAVDTVQAQTFLPVLGSASWATATNWSTGLVPDGVGEGVVFDSPTAARTITVDSGATGFTIGALVFNNDSAFNNALQVGTTGSNLILDNGGLGVELVFNGSGLSLGNQTISSAMVFNDSVTAHVNYVANATSGVTTQGAFNWTGSVSGGSGGFTKQGFGVMTFGTANKRYTGPTVFDTDSGRTRISVAGSPTQTSSVTVKSGSQLTLVTVGTYTWGTGPLNLNGSGPTIGPQAAFPGVIRNDTNLAATITNPVVLQTDSLIHVQGAATGSTTFSNGVSGPGGLAFTAPNSSADIGVLVLAGSGTFTGSTVVNAGTLRAAATTGSALGSTSSVIINSQAPAGGANGILQLGASHQINDFASMGLSGGTFNTGGFSESLSDLSLSTSSIIDMGNLSSLLAFENSSFNLWTGTLSIFNWSGNLGVGGGVDQLFFGSDTTGLTPTQLDSIIFYSDGGFTLAGTGEAQMLSTGEVVAVPEPGAIAILLGGFGTLLGVQRLRRRH